VCQPAPYFFSILSNATIWPLLWLVTGISEKSICGLLAVLVILLARIALAQNLQLRLIGARAGRPREAKPSEHAGGRPALFWLVPMKDLLQVAIWFGAFAGNTVEWRGRRMRLKRNGTLAAE
jgi:ceramide glucosyltransferase